MREWKRRRFFWGENLITHVGGKKWSFDFYNHCYVKALGSERLTLTRYTWQCRNQIP